MILNCGHLVHAVCWIDFLFAIEGGAKAVCPGCETPYTDAMPFRVRMLKLEHFTLPEAVALEGEFTNLARAVSGAVDALVDDFEVI